MVRISISEMKFEEITVTCQPARPSRPIMLNPAKKQLANGSTTHRIALKTMANMATRNTNTPKPNVTRSLRIKVIMSSAIIDTPPRTRDPASWWRSMTSRTATIVSWRFWFNWRFCNSYCTSSWTKRCFSSDVALPAPMRCDILRRSPCKASNSGASSRLSCRAVVLPSALTISSENTGLVVSSSRALSRSTSLSLNVR